MKVGNYILLSQHYKPGRIYIESEDDYVHDDNMRYGGYTPFLVLESERMLREVNTYLSKMVCGRIRISASSWELKLPWTMGLKTRQDP